MGKVLKFAIGILLGIVLVVGIALGFTLVKGGESIRIHLEEMISQTIGTPTKIASLQINPFQGTIQMRSLQMNNPEGLTTPFLMKIDGIDVDVVPLSLLQEVVVIHRLAIRNWQINIEQNLTKGNISGIVTHLQKNRSQGPSGSPEKGTAGMKKVMAGTVSIDKFTTQIKLAFFQQSFDRTFIVDSVELTNVTPENSPEILLSEFIRRLILQGFRVVSQQAKTEISQGLPTQLPNIPFLRENPLDALQNFLNSLQVPE